MRSSLGEAKVTNFKIIFTINCFMNSDEIVESQPPFESPDKLKANKIIPYGAISRNSSSGSSGDDPNNIMG